MLGYIFYKKYIGFLLISYKELISFIWQFVRIQKWTFFFLFFLNCFAWSLDALIWPYILRVIINIFSQFDANRLEAWDALTRPIIGALGLVIYVEVASRIMGFFMARAMPKLEADIRKHMFNHIQYHSPRYFNERFSGALANKITDMVTHVESIIKQLFFPIVPALATCILGSFFLGFINPVFAAIFLIWTIIHTGICLYFTKRVDQYEHEHGLARSELMGKIVDSFTNNLAVNLFYRFRFENKLLLPFQQKEKHTNHRAKKSVEKMKVYLSIFYFTVVVLGMFGLLVYLWLSYRISTGEVIQVFTTMWSFAMILWSIGIAFPSLFQSFGTAKQAYSVMKEPNDLGDKPEAKPLIVSGGEIIFDNVSFHYGDKKLFVNKHAHIKGGEKVGLVGYTGSGKSTFINLILRFFPLHEGKIMIDGQDIAKSSLESIRSQIALIPQDPVLFHRTLWENITYGKPNATKEEVLSAAKLAHCEEFIQHIPGQYQAKVGERGTKLSGGEKQRIAIARAILADAPILILDEATSALDSVTERYIQDSLEKIMQGRTTIVIAHRLSTLSRMDRILVFDKGKIVEEGHHDDLLKKTGLYAKMWHMQVNGFLPN